MANSNITSESIIHRIYITFIQLTNEKAFKIFFIYWSLGLLLIPFYQFQVDPDGISYLNITHLYTIGDFRDAINGYWQPLISWLLIPFSLAKFQPLFAQKVVSLIIGFLTLLAIRRLSYRFILNEQVRFLTSLAAIPMLLSYTFLGIAGADLLQLCIALYYLYYIFDPDYSQKASYAFIIGLLGALLYLSKSYGFYFFIAHFSLFTVIFYIKSKTSHERRTVLLKYVFGLTIFVIVCGIWVACLSNKYQHFTISNSGEHNTQLDSPGSQGQPVLYQGLLPLPYPAAVSTWDDPSYLTIQYEKSPELLNWITFQVAHVGGNVFRSLYYFELFSVFSIAVVLIYAFRYCGKLFYFIKESIQKFKRRDWRGQLQYAQGQNDGTLHNSVLYSLITILLYTAGFELLHIEVQYLWIDAILLLLLCADYACNTRFDFVRNVKLRQLLFLIIFLSFCLYPMLDLVRGVNEDKDIYTTSTQLQTVYHLKGNIASNDDGDATNSWGLALFYTYFLDSKYYGATQKNITDEELQNQLKKYHIDYYFVWNGVCRLSECEKITEAEPRFLWTYPTKHLIIYRIKP